MKEQLTEIDRHLIKDQYWLAIRLISGAAANFEEVTGESMSNSSRRVCISRQVCFALQNYVGMTGEKWNLFKDIGYSFTILYCWDVPGFKCVIGIAP